MSRDNEHAVDCQVDDRAPRYGPSQARHAFWSIGNTKPRKRIQEGDRDTGEDPKAGERRTVQLQGMGQQKRGAVVPSHVKHV